MTALPGSGKPELTNRPATPDEQARATAYLQGCGFDDEGELLAMLGLGVAS